MNTKDISREQISALADGELTAQHLDVALAALRQPEGRADWEIYHQIGDVLRSDDMAIQMSSGFAARMAARLEAEPVLVAPVAHVLPANADRDMGVAQTANGLPAGARNSLWRLPNMIAAAAVATVAFVATPQLMVALTGEAAVSESTASAVPVQPVEAISSGAPVLTANTTTMPEGVILRDPRIDDYLLAHQRFSPSVYSSAQYARSATFATDSNK